VFWSDGRLTGRSNDVTGPRSTSVTGRPSVRTRRLIYYFNTYVGSDNSIERLARGGFSGRPQHAGGDQVQYVNQEIPVAGRDTVYTSNGPSYRDLTAHAIGHRPNEACGPTQTTGSNSVRS